MAEYTLTASNFVQRNRDSAFIPFDELNTDYQEYLQWVAQGNTADPYVEDPVITADKARRASFDADATRADILNKLRTSTPAQISSYVDANVTTLAEARTMLKRILLVLAQ